MLEKIIGFVNGYTGLIEGDYQELEEEDFDDESAIEE